MQLPQVLLSVALMLTPGCLGGFTYNVYRDSSCSNVGVTAEVADETQACLDLGVSPTGNGNSMAIISCSPTCVCFTQYGGSQNCNVDGNAMGSNVKEACNNKCQADCNGDMCGLDPNTRPSMYLGIIGTPECGLKQVAADTYTCNTTGMVGRDPDPAPSPNPDPVPSPNPDPVPSPNPDPVPSPSTDATCGEIKEAYQQSGCCGYPEKQFDMPNRRLSAIPNTDISAMGTPEHTLHSIALALQDAKAKGGAEKLAQLKQRLNDMLAKFE